MNLCCFAGTIDSAPNLVQLNGNNDRCTFFFKIMHRGGANLPPVIQIVADGKLALFASAQLCKGSRVTIIGSLLTDLWTSPDQKTHKRIFIRASQIEKL